jgi:hypothetical protein
MEDEPMTIYTHVAEVNPWSELGAALKKGPAPAVRVVTLAGTEILGHAVSLTEGWVRIRTAGGTLWLNMDAIETWAMHAEKT